MNRKMILAALGLVGAMAVGGKIYAGKVADEKIQKQG